MNISFFIRRLYVFSTLIFYYSSFYLTDDYYQGPCICLSLPFRRRMLVQNSSRVGYGSHVWFWVLRNSFPFQIYFYCETLINDEISTSGCRCWTSTWKKTHHLSKFLNQRSFIDFFRVIKIVIYQLNWTVVWRKMLNDKTKHALDKIRFIYSGLTHIVSKFFLSLQWPANCVCDMTLPFIDCRLSQIARENLEKTSFFYRI